MSLRDAVWGNYTSLDTPPFCSPHRNLKSLSLFTVSSCADGSVLVLMLVALPLYLFFNSAPSLRCGGQTELHAVLKVWSLKVLFKQLQNYTIGLILSTWWWPALFHWFFFILFFIYLFVCCCSLTWRFQSCQLWFKSFLLSYSCPFWAQQHQVWYAAFPKKWSCSVILLPTDSVLRPLVFITVKTPLHCPNLQLWK